MWTIPFLTEFGKSHFIAGDNFLEIETIYRSYRIWFIELHFDGAFDSSGGAGGRANFGSSTGMFCFISLI